MAYVEQNFFVAQIEFFQLNFPTFYETPLMTLSCYLSIFFVSAFHYMQRKRPGKMYQSQRRISVKVFFSQNI